MLALLTFLLALSVSGITIPSKTITPFNSTDALSSVITKRDYPACSPSKLANIDSCSCFVGDAAGDAVGIDGHWMIDAYAYRVAYPPNHADEEGDIRLLLWVRELPECTGPIRFSRETCTEGFVYPLVCNLDSDDHKYGGLVRQGCLWFILDPNPSINVPYDLTTD